MELYIPQGVQAASREIPIELVENGLLMKKEFISSDEEIELLRFIDNMPWESRLSRRTQHYGFRFDYATKRCIRAEFPVPPIFEKLIVSRLGWEFDETRLQCTVNEYFPGQGIAPHVDTHEAFADVIVALSLADGVALRLKSVVDEMPNIHVIWLEPRSLISYADKVRYAYTHGIISRKGDLIDGVWRPRHRRVSLTFRRTRLEDEQCQCKFPKVCDARGAPKFLPTRLKEKA